MDNINIHSNIQKAGKIEKKRSTEISENAVGFESLGLANSY